MGAFANFDWKEDMPFSMIGSAISAGVSAKVAYENRKFQERMTKNRYQYQMEDMRKAGLNPILASGQAPPGAPPGAMAQIPDFGKTMYASALAKKQGEQAESGTRLNDATARLKTAEAARAEVEARLWGAPASALDWLETKKQGATDWLSDQWNSAKEGMDRRNKGWKEYDQREAVEWPSKDFQTR
jgi:hypothetical protein